MQSDSQPDFAMDFDVVIPVHNRIATLQRAIQSVLEQELAASRVIIVDDASTIDLSKVREWAIEAGCRWKRLGRNVGPAEARNRGVDEGESRWIAFLDSDDTWSRGKLRLQAEWIAGNPESRISQVRERWIREGRELKKPSHWEPREGDLFEQSCQRCSIGSSCVAIRRDLWVETGGFDARYRVCEDYQLWLRITKSEPVGLVPGLPQVDKHGGHADQLSSLVPAMDRFRVLALLELLAESGLSLEQRATACSVVKEKARILAEGAAKRGMIRRAELYAMIDTLDLGGVASSLRAVASTLWGEVLSG